MTIKIYFLPSSSLFTFTTNKISWLCCDKSWQDCVPNHQMKLTSCVHSVATVVQHGTVKQQEDYFSFSSNILLTNTNNKVEIIDESEN